MNEPEKTYLDEAKIVFTQYLKDHRSLLTIEDYKARIYHGDAVIFWSQTAEKPWMVRNGKVALINFGPTSEEEVYSRLV